MHSLAIWRVSHFLCSLFNVSCKRLWRLCVSRDYRTLLTNTCNDAVNSVKRCERMASERGAGGLRDYCVILCGIQERERQWSIVVRGRLGHFWVDSVSSITTILLVAQCRISYSSRYFHWQPFSSTSRLYRYIIKYTVISNLSKQLCPVVLGIINTLRDEGLGKKKETTLFPRNEGN